MNTIITRFPPSPTGYLHIGGARTALFNWLWARKNAGQFVLRIEDTDEARSTKESVDAILESMEWLGIDWDDGPYFQTQRHDIYNEHIDRLVEQGHAYYCDCTPEEVNAMREEAKAKGLKPMYNGKCRNRGLKKGTNTVVRLKTPDTGVTIVDDIVKGSTAFQNTEIDDFIIQRSSGMAMYNLAVVVDDITMGINTIIRGDDHVMNTPKQIQLYKALGCPLPVFGHVPMVLGKDRTRLSKRHGATSVTAYREMGFLPEAMLNYLVRLGWSHGDQEFFTREELIEVFNLESIGRAAGVFDPEKLSALNSDHMKAIPPTQLVDRLRPFMKARGVELLDRFANDKVAASLAPRSKTLVEMADQALFYYQDEIAYDPDAARKFLNAESLPALRTLTAKLDALEVYTEPALEDAFKAVMAETGLKLGKIAQPVRVALSGRAASPGIFEITAIIGKEKTLRRLRRAIAYIGEDK